MASPWSGADLGAGVSGGTPRSFTYIGRGTDGKGATFVKHAISAKTAVLAAVVVLAGATVVGAMTAPDDDPEGDEPDGVEESVDQDEQGDDAKADEDKAAAKDEAKDKEGGDESKALEVETGKPTDNHGAAVSAVAHDDSLEGREHGKAVSEVARSDIGKKHADKHGGGDTEDEESDGDD
jgi:hypothetical protein